MFHRRDTKPNWQQRKCPEGLNQHKTEAERTCFHMSAFSSGCQRFYVIRTEARAVFFVILDKLEPSHISDRSLKLGGLLIYPLAPWSCISQHSGRQMSEHMLPDWGFEHKIPLIGWTGTGSNPRHPRRLLAHPPPLSSSSLYMLTKGRKMKKTTSFPSLALCHYRTDALRVKRYDAELQGAELYITSFWVFALFHVYFTSSFP